MVSIQEVRSELSTIKRLGPGLVAVFVGGTSGIGEGTARAIVQHADKPKIYLIGRKQEEADRIIAEFKKLNADSQTTFIKSDVSLVKNVDQVCDDIKQREEKVNILVMSAGYLTTQGRNETVEGLDKKFALHFYNRLRFAENLLPLLNKAAETTDSKYPVTARVISALGAGLEKEVDTTDLSLKRTFSLPRCANHAITMGSVSWAHLAAENPKVSFIHTEPGPVKTNAARPETMGKAMSMVIQGASVLLSPFMQSAEVSGERHAWAATVDKFGKGGAFWLSSVGELQKNGGIMEKLKTNETQEKVVAHTKKVFEEISTTGKYSGD